MGIRYRFLRLLSAGLCALSLLVLAQRPAGADDLTAIRQRGTLKVGVKTDYPPFGFRSASGEITGIEPALAADIARNLRVGLQLVPVAASNRVELLRQGDIDLIIATMNPTMERRMAVEIVRPYYYESGFNLLLPATVRPASWTELKAKAVCGIKGAYYNYEAAANFQLHVAEFAGPVDALQAMQAGECIGVLYDDAWIEGELLNPRSADAHMPLPSQEVQPWGLAVRKDQPRWAAYLSGIVKEWQRNGTVAALETSFHLRHAAPAAAGH
jgi:polar amino acid transport system substrate-binding protein